jgi:hypothetical protein
LMHQMRISRMIPLKGKDQSDQVKLHLQIIVNFKE